MVQNQISRMDFNNMNEAEYAIHSKINDFQVIVIYHYAPRAFDFDFLTSFPSEKIRSKVNSKRILPRVQSKSFVIWKPTYENNINLFKQLRYNAREEILLRMAEFVIAKVFHDYEDYLSPILKNNLKLKWDLINELFYKFNALLRNGTELLNDQAWDEFNYWFKSCLLKLNIEKLGAEYSYRNLLDMPKEHLNHLFFQEINQNFSTDKFINQLTDIVNDYLQTWTSKLISMVEIDDIPLTRILGILRVGKIISNGNGTNTIYNNHLTVMSNIVYQTTLEVLSNKGILSEKGSKGLILAVQNGKLNGSIQILSHHPKSASLIKSNQRKESSHVLPELVIDIINILCDILLTKSQDKEDTVRIYLDDLLALRGLKAKLAGNGYRGGYEAKQRGQLCDVLWIIQHLWVNFQDVVMYQNRKQIHTDCTGFFFIFTDKNGKHLEFNLKEIPTQFQLKAGTALEPFLKGDTKQVMLLPTEVVQYDPYRMKWEKKLIRYLSWRWRIQAHKAAYMQPYKIGTLLTRIGMDLLNYQAPSRIRDRLESALDNLQQAGLIAGWQYANWDEGLSLKKGWMRHWKEATAIIIPANEIVEFYKPLERGKQRNSSSSMSALLDHKPNNLAKSSLLAELKEKRKLMGWKQEQVAQELGISISYLSHIERGRKNPSERVWGKIHQWLHK